MKINRTNILVLSVGLLVLVGMPDGIAARSHAVRLSDPAELEAFMDGVIEAQLEAYNIVGATVAVVKNGSLFFSKGYGYADLAARRLVLADQTLFRIASVSKLFVWTAVMQLVEQGKLDLDTDINIYLNEFKIPDTYDEPVNMAHLMTHTAGFEDFVIRLFMKNADRLWPLGELLAQELPARVRPPGDIASYSNHGAAIAAYIVEQVSGMPWDDYVEKNILEPLEMAHSTFRQPLPPELAMNISKGYTSLKGDFREQAFLYVPLAPVNSASTTATDMANFMIAHLNHGRFGNARILGGKTAQQMHSALFRHAPEVNPMAHGFFDVSCNGQRVIGHDGYFLYFHSIMALLPEHKVGLFVSYNTQGAEKAVMNIYKLFLERYYPLGKVQASTLGNDSSTQLQRFTGSYFSSRRVHRRFTKLGALLGTVKVRLTDDGVLKTIGKETTRWIETKPLTFREENGFRTLVFREDTQGRITHMFIGDLPHKAFERIGYKDSIILHMVLAIAAILLFIITAVSWPFAALIRRQHNVKMDPRTRIPRLAYIIAWSASLLFVVIAAIFAVGLAEPNSIVFGIPLWIKIIMVLAVIAALMTAGTLFYAFVIWNSDKGSTWERIYYTAVTLTLSLEIWQLNHWKLLGFHY